jgi:hypothetical protein
MHEDRIFLISTEKALAELVKGPSQPSCMVGDCLHFEKIAQKEALLYDVGEGRKHSARCMGNLDVKRIRKFELAIIDKALQNKSILLANLDGVFRERHEEFLKMFTSLSKGIRHSKARVYLYVNDEMKRELAFFSDRILR